MRSVILLATFVLCGCHTLRVGSPQIQRAPEITCIVLVEGDKVSPELAKAAIDACRDAMEKKP